MKRTQLPRKLTALLLAAVMVVSMLPTVAFAESGQTYNVGTDTALSFVSQTYTVDGDIGGLTECGDAITDGMDVYVTEYNGADPYGIATMANVTGTISTGNSYGYNSAWLTEFSPYTSCDIKYFNGQPAYCIEPHKGTANGQSVSASSYLGNKKLMLALAYGYGGVDDSTLLYYSNFSDYAWLATQEVIWEIVGGYSDLSDLFIGPNHSYDASVAVPIKNAHDYIWDCINQQHKRPSFSVGYPNNSSNDIELSWNGSAWTATVTDTNYVLPNFDTFRFSLNGVTTSRSGYRLTITATPEAAKSMTSGLASQRSEANFIDPDDINAYLLTPTSSGAQDCVALNGWPDPVYAYIRAKVTQTTGDLTIVKTSEDGKVSGVSFTITGPNSYGKTATTNAQGKISLTDLQPGTYTVKENAASYYVAPASQNVSVSIGDTKTVTFNNTLKRGTLRVTKTSEDGIVAGHTFKLTGTSTSGQSVNMTATTNSSGIATFSNVPIGTNYRLEEVNTAAKYVVPSVQTGVSVTYGGTTNKYFYNSLARGSVRVTKTSEDDIVSGVTFKLTGTSTSGQAVNMTATTDSSGIATFSNVLIGTNYKIEEVNTAARYVVPSVVSGVTVTLNTTTPVSVYNALKRGNLKVTKTSEDGLVSGVTFKLSGTSFNGTTVNMTATTDSSGVATFSNVLIGSNYTVEEVGTANRYVVPAVQENLTISLNTTTPVSFYNQLARGKVVVTKTAEDNKVEGIKFRLTGTSIGGTVVDMVATTNAQGVATFDGVLIGSNYTLEEYETQEKYIIPASITGINVTLNSTVNKSMHNVLKRGDLVITKTSEDNIVAGMKFRLTGTSLSGAAIDETATTDANGVARFSNILIGSNYKVEEIDTPNRYVVPAVQEGVVIPVNNDPLADSDNTARLQFYNKLARGSVEVTKTSEDGDVAGVKFRLSGTAINGEKVDVQAVTNTQGVALFENILIGNNYTVEEVDTAEKYIVPAVVEGVCVTLNNKTPVSVRNVLKRGHLKVTKNSEDGLVEGISFRLTGTSLSGAPVDETVQTNAQGIAMFRDILIGSNYSLQEVDTATKYVIPAVQSDIDITYNVTADTEMTNVLKKWKVTVIKRDAETGATPQGDGTFEGAVYGLYKDGDLVKQYTIGADGTFTTDEYVCNDGYTIREDTAPLGYKLDPTVYTVGSEAKEYTVEHNTAPDITSSEQIKRGTFSITKIVSAAPGLVQRFEVGAVFQYYLKSAGSYENAKDGERGTLTTNADGETGTSISLPYGTYVVHQTQSAVGVKLAPDFTVLIGDKPDGTNKPLIVHNEPVAGYIRVVKVDADDDEVIPWSGARFEIYDPSGEKITQQVTYPSVQNISVFETNDNGYFITPLMLPYGVGYKLVEVAAPEGYELSETPIYFDVTPDTVETDDVTGIEYVHVTFSDDATPPTVDTVAAGINGGKKIFPATNMTITDTVDCSGVIPGKSYTVKGWLVLKSTGLPLLDADGQQITASETFTADQNFSGQVELRFTLDATKLTNDTVVVFDELYRGEKLVATHTDIEDEDQAVEVRHRPYYKTEEKPELPPTGDAGLDGYMLAALFALEGCAVMLRRRKRG